MQFLSNIIKGILGFITGFFKPKTKQGFFLEYEGESTAAETQSAGTSTAKPAPAMVVSEASPAESPAKSSKTFRGAKAPEVAPAAPVAAVTSTALNLPAPKVTFADVAMNPASGPAISRRRPGANMSGFLNMARQAATPR